MKDTIKLSRMEIQSNHDRVKQAELLICQLPNTHEGRNSWLMNYGIGTEANRIRINDPERLKEAGYDPRKLTWDYDTQCLFGTTIYWDCKYCGENEEPKCHKCVREDGLNVSDELVD